MFRSLMTLMDNQYQKLNKKIDMLTKQTQTKHNNDKNAFTFHSKLINLPNIKFTKSLTLCTAHNTHAALQSHSVHNTQHTCRSTVSLCAQHTTHMPLYSLTLCTAHNTHAALQSHSVHSTQHTCRSKTCCHIT